MDKKQDLKNSPKVLGLDVSTKTFFSQVFYIYVKCVKFLFTD